MGEKHYICDMRIIGLSIGSLMMVLSFCSSTIVYAQTRVNPFEVRQRVGKVTTTTPIVSPADTTAGSVTDSIQPTMIDTSTAALGTTDSTISILDGSNPFEVDHVPIRNSQLTKRKEILIKNLTATKRSDNFLIWFLLFSCGFLAIVLNSGFKNLGYITRGLFNDSMLKLLFREESTRFSSYFVLLYFIFIINLSIAIYLILGYYNGPKGVIVLLSIMGALTLVYIIRHLGLMFMGNIFGVSKNANLYSFTILLFNSCLGIVLLPLNFLMAYSPDQIKQVSIYLTLAIIGILLLLRLVRGLFIASEFIFQRLFQFFIYLCAVEIVPVLLLVKWLSTYGKSI
jgi:hypothetical protein